MNNNKRKNTIMGKEHFLEPCHIDTVLKRFINLFIGGTTRMDDKVEILSKMISCLLYYAYMHIPRESFLQSILQMNENIVNMMRSINEEQESEN
ncbi:MAG: hypothetical protein H7833_00405 [Magnetococcus sp. DMHC-1]